MRSIEVENQRNSSGENGLPKGGDQRRVHHKKDRTKFLSVLRAAAGRHRITSELSVLIVGGSEADSEALHSIGLHEVTLSDLASDSVRLKSGPVPGAPGDLDVEAMNLKDESFDLVFAHEVLHHCRSPHRALCEMLRVSRRFVLFLEPNDSLFMRSLVWAGMSFPYELPAVIDHGGLSGGVRDTNVPNFIFRWNRADVMKTVSSFLAEREFSVDCEPYWDFNVDEYELSLRRRTRIGTITSAVGARNFLRLIRFCSKILNAARVLRHQGNKHFCLVEKTWNLRPWLALQGSDIIFTGDPQSSPGNGQATPRRHPMDIKFSLRVMI
jgi:SAM-dependent methyltransferase